MSLKSFFSSSSSNHPLLQKFQKFESNLGVGNGKGVFTNIKNDVKDAEDKIKHGLETGLKDVGIVVLIIIGLLIFVLRKI